MNRNQMMAQARKMQEQLLAAQEKAALTLHTASAGGGAVKVTVNGDDNITTEISQTGDDTKIGLKLKKELRLVTMGNQTCL